MSTFFARRTAARIGSRAAVDPPRPTGLTETIRRAVGATIPSSFNPMERRAMEMNQIRYFLALCGELNFTRAAKRCGVAQPSLTNAIKALEAELRGALFYRTPAVRLTELGQAIRPSLENVALYAEEAKRCAARRSGRSVARKRYSGPAAAGRPSSRASLQ